MSRLFNLIAALILACASQTFALGQQANDQSGAQAEERIYTRKEVDQPAKLIYKPEPKITEEARRHNYRSEMRLRVVLGTNGKVTQVELFNKALYGMEEACAAAAREIKFEPALKDGRPVSQYLQIVYHWEFF